MEADARILPQKSQIDLRRTGDKGERQRLLTPISPPNPGVYCKRSSSDTNLFLVPMNPSDHSNAVKALTRTTIRPTTNGFATALVTGPANAKAMPHRSELRATLMLAA